MDSTFKLAENSDDMVDFRFYEPLRETKIGSKIGVVGEIGRRAVPHGQCARLRIEQSGF